MYPTVFELILITGRIILRIGFHLLLLQTNSIRFFSAEFCLLVLRPERRLLRDDELVFFLFVFLFRLLNVGIQLWTSTARLVSGCDEPGRKSADAVCVVAHTNQQRRQSNGQIEAVPRLPVEHGSRRGNHGRISVCRIQLIIVKEIRQKLRTRFVLIELLVRQMRRSQSRWQEFRHSVLIRWTQKEEAVAVHVDELILKLAHML
mmetsp:Transcript_21197/g.49332  ORF Transcript_21197/g.49332 Transcript_21197/m.49332 type:complete len:204 (-) Transcript_21197:199-810(-)